MSEPSAVRASRIEVPADPRDLPGVFRHRFVVEVRFGDTDAMGHANNSRFLTYCESSRIAYWETATGEPFALVTHGAEESLILAEIRVTFRSPAVFGETLTVESRAGRIGRTSFTLEHRLTASASARGKARLVATADDILVLYDYALGRPRVIPDRDRRPARGVRGAAAARLTGPGRPGSEVPRRTRGPGALPEAIPRPMPRSAGRWPPRSGRRTRTR